MRLFRRRHASPTADRPRADPLTVTLQVDASAGTEQSIEVDADNELLSLLEEALREHLPFGMEGAAHAQAVAVLPIVVGRDLVVEGRRTPAEEVLEQLCRDHSQSRSVDDGVVSCSLCSGTGWPCGVWVAAARAGLVEER
jgi:hypothetical protein